MYKTELVNNQRRTSCSSAATQATYDVASHNECIHTDIISVSSTPEIKYVPPCVLNTSIVDAELLGPQCILPSCDRGDEKLHPFYELGNCFHPLR